MVGARGPGGIQGLREVAESHPDELVWELHQLGLDLRDDGSIRDARGKAVDHVKVDRLLRVATRDPASHLFAARAGWDYPLSREGIQQADLFDALNQLIKITAGSKQRLKPYPRPWKDTNSNRWGKTSLSPAEAREVLRKNRG